jgi:N-acetylneuraminate synthase
MVQIKIGDRVISDDSPVFFIAEIGINHNGSLELAKEIIDLTVACKADAVKFQKRTPELCVPEKYKDRIVETPWGVMTYIEYRRKVEFGEAEYQEIARYCQEKNVIWFASAWDLPSVDFLEKYNVPCHKIASGQLTNMELLEKVKQLGKPIILSTGMSTEEEIDNAVQLLKGTDLILLHCNSSYPAADNELNLNYIPRLKQKYPELIIGYSGHERGITASLVAANLGAKVIERHVTSDRAMWGSDQGASIEYPGLRRLIRDLRNLPYWLGDGKKRVYESEIKLREKLRNKNTLQAGAR